LEPKPVNKVVVGLSSLSEVQNDRETNARAPHEKKGHPALPKNKIKNREGHENEKQIDHLKPKNLELLIKTAADWYGSETQATTPRGIPR